jgi:hypothetical protein
MHPAIKAITFKPAAKLVALESVGSLIDPATGTIYPQFADGTPDLDCGIDVDDEPSDDWCAALSTADAKVVGDIVKGLN